MAEYKLTNKAVVDLNIIWDYTVKNCSEYQADKYYSMFIESFQDIANNPGLGKKYSEISSDLFGLKANRHIIFYRKLQDKPIEITRILHERMDLKNRIND